MEFLPTKKIPFLFRFPDSGLNAISVLLFLPQKNPTILLVHLRLIFELRENKLKLKLERVCMAYS